MKTAHFLSGICAVFYCAIWCVPKNKRLICTPEIMEMPGMCLKQCSLQIVVSNG